MYEPVVRIPGIRSTFVLKTSLSTLPKPRNEMCPYDTTGMGNIAPPWVTATSLPSHPTVQQALDTYDQ